MIDEKQTNNPPKNNVVSGVDQN